ncbi:2,3-dihydro-2,3-dihydroxybenzoate dehydrogenase [Streptomyces albipurpureus]|uniref:2,3-dihydro-2,3-dihydroxybenzoate dehydrogenase n=1 Tax=Streptomyces albipurpureus TaxID=2897419 RepID=A0ABT0UF14_9ACTN|nr:2,3-dihydro-2,3-dihydroxybenzoate dehydrogenase [Streptomyces sp. CWNU-1]MCM2386955.1 2,3-dihydro-2,3-dihydroxybenzoate dehydrogenase [Streptomyces sp. CWNU-1]
MPDRRAFGGEFAGRVALVTGAGQGIGAAVTQALAALGATVAATDRAADTVSVVASALTEEFEDDPTAGPVNSYALDVTDVHAVEETVDRVERELGPVDILVNVAGVLRTAPVLELTDRDWAETFAVNTTGVFHVSRAVVARMAPRGTGCVVTVASNAAGIPRPRMAAYAASKAAAVMFTKCLGLEQARNGIRCNVVAPGSTDTPMQRALWADESDAVRVVDGDPHPAAYRTGIPLGRIARPQDIADAVTFLASDRARQITMHDLYVDGGATLR